MSQAPVILWFKRDLRLHDHAPLWHAAQLGHPVIPLYIVEPEYWNQPFASARHWRFVRECLMELSQGLEGLGQPLVIRKGSACDVIRTLNKEFGCDRLLAHEETADLWTYERDKSVRRLCRELGVEVQEYPTNGVVRRLGSRDDWAKLRNQRMAEPVLPKPTRLVAYPDCRSDPLPALDDPMFGTLMRAAQTGGRKAAVTDLTSFLTDRSARYVQHISSPQNSVTSCSRLSAHLAWGTLSAREVVQALESRKAALSPMDKPRFARNLKAFGSRLAWRCHFVQKLEDQPTLETHCMHPAFEGLRDEDFDPIKFDAWSRGATGFPFVDACMRSLIETGWINFRMRAMLVSFASYQLWLDWRKTAPVLARLFTDYEPGIHYSQFQMQSGVTGINAIRVYNPIKQSHDQDPSGRFIRTWVPELRNIDPEFVHEPWLAKRSLFANDALGTYPAPIVNNAEAMRLAKDRIAAVRKSEPFRAAAKTVYAQHGSRKRTRRKTPRPDRPDQLSLF